MEKHPHGCDSTRDESRIRGDKCQPINVELTLKSAQLCWNELRESMAQLERSGLLPGLRINGVLENGCDNGQKEHSPITSAGYDQFGGKITIDSAGNKRISYADKAYVQYNKDGTGHDHKPTKDGGYTEHHWGPKPQDNYELRRTADGRIQTADSWTTNWRDTPVKTDPKGDETPPKDGGDKIPPPQPQPGSDHGIGTGNMRGVNLSGAEFGGTWNGRYGTDYIYPSAEDLAYYKEKGATVVRLPFRWERMQPELGGPLDPQELKRMDQFIESAGKAGIKVILDAHNFGRYKDQVIGTPAVPYSSFKDFWTRMADHYEHNSTIWAFDIMNEPHDTGGHWSKAAQAAVDGIRTQDMNHKIMIEGDSWSGAKNWKNQNGDLHVNDPANGIIYQAHAYFDRDNSGSYKESFDAQGAHKDIGVDDVKPFLDWLKENNSQGFIGEFGVPNNSPQWLEAQDRFLTYLDQAGVGYTAWGGGPWWKDYQLSTEQKNGQDRPSMDVIEKHLGQNA